MKKICLIVPYFGTLPKNFGIWLQSCRYNPTINWLVITNDKTDYTYPENVKMISMSFEDLVDKIRKMYDFDICLDIPYKLCDYKVAYGEIFIDLLEGYDYWGYCDIDLIFGNIRNFITDEILDAYSKILSRGHFTLFRNNEKINSLYKTKIDGVEKYKEIFGNPRNHSFDEWRGDKAGINDIFKFCKLPFYDEIVFADISIKRFGFYSAQLKERESKETHNIYLWDKGTLSRYFLKNHKVHSQEVMYLHLQKRKMKNELNDDDPERILILPNRYQPIDFDLDVSALKNLGKDKIIYWDYLWLRYNNLKKRIKQRFT